MVGAILRGCETGTYGSSASTGALIGRSDANAGSITVTGGAVTDLIVRVIQIRVGEAGNE